MAMAMVTLDAAQGLVGNSVSLPPRPSSWLRRPFCWWVFRALAFRACSCWASSPGELVACTLSSFPLLSYWDCCHGSEVQGEEGGRDGRDEGRAKRPSSVRGSGTAGTLCAIAAIMGASAPS